MVIDLEMLAERVQAAVPEARIVEKPSLWDGAPTLELGVDDRMTRLMVIRPDKDPLINQAFIDGPRLRLLLAVLNELDRQQGEQA